MTTSDTMPAPPDLPFTLEPGDTPARSTLALVRARWWIVGVIAVIFVVSGAVRGGLRGAVLAAVATSALVLGVAALVFVLVRITSGYRITVTHTELVIERVRRRTLPRSEVGELVVGFFTVPPRDPAGIQLCFTTRGGKRFATTTIIHWPAGGLLQVAAALGVEPRDQDRERDRRLQPMFIRRPLLFRLVLMALSLVVPFGIVLVAMALAG